MTSYDDRPLVLRPGVRLVPVTELATEITGLREVSGVTDRHVAIVHEHSRGPLRVVGSDVARLLALFEAPHTVSAAVAEFAARAGMDPLQALTSAAPLILRLLRSTLLVPADRAQFFTVDPTFETGRTLDIGLSVLDCVHLTEDTEVYRGTHRGGNLVALKILRLPLDAAAVGALDRELHALAAMDNVVNPPLLDAGIWNDRPYLVLGWRPGVAADAAAHLLRGPRADHAARAHHLACAIVEAYAHLHSLEVVHGDVHPGNVIVEPDGAICLIDYGNSAASSGPTERPELGWSIGRPEFAAPEVLAGDQRSPVPKPTVSSEQYSVAVLVDLILTGVPLRAGHVVPAELLPSVADKRPSSFGQRGIAAWPELEGVLSRALEPDPDRRFRSLGEFAQQLRRVRPRGEVPRHPITRRGAVVAAARSVLASVLEDVSSIMDDGRWPTEDLTVANGAAGIALALVDIARRRGDQRLVTLADLYATRACRDAASHGLSPRSLYYGTPGIHLAEAIVAAELHDLEFLPDSTNRVLEAADDRCGPLELFAGQAGVLLGCAVLLEELAASGCLLPTVNLRAAGDALCSWVGERSPLPDRGMAHGQDGVLFAVLRWCRASGRAVPHIVDAHLRELATKPSRGSGSWCDGASGRTALWTLAAQCLPDPDPFLRCAEGAATDVWNCVDPAFDLCCGMGGRAHAMLEMYRFTGGRVWLRRGRDLTERAVELMAEEQFDPHRYSLWHGALGVALLADQIEDPDSAHMPLM